MPFTILQLQTPITRDQALTTMLNNLQALGFNVTSWQSGSVQRTILTEVAETWSTATEFVATLVNMAFNDTSTDAALTTFSDSHYDNQRVTNVLTQGEMIFTGGAVGPPHTVSPGDVRVQETVSSQTYINITGGTIPLSGSVTLDMEAQSPGVAGNIGTGLATLELVTSFSGVSVTNPLIVGSTTWITQLGVDEEADATLQTRNTTKWTTLNFATPDGAYVQISLRADSDITRVTADDTNPRGPGTVDVYIARATGVATGADVTQVQTTGTDDFAVDKKRPVTADALVIAAPAQAVTVTGTIHITTSLDDAAGVKRAEIEQAAIDYVNSLDIGGEVLPPATTGVLVFSELLGAITAVVGVRSVSLSSPTADVPISGFSVATLGAPSFSYVTID